MTKNQELTKNQEIFNVLDKNGILFYTILKIITQANDMTLTELSEKIGVTELALYKPTIGQIQLMNLAHFLEIDTLSLAKNYVKTRKNKKLKKAKETKR